MTESVKKQDEALVYYDVFYPPPPSVHEFDWISFN